MLPTVRINSRWPKMLRNYMLPWESGILLTQLDSIRPKRMIEFGINEGFTASSILKWIDSIEFYVGVDVPFTHRMPLVGQQGEVPKEPGHLVKTDPRFELILRHSDSIEDADTLIASKAPFDVAFIDGDHSYAAVMQDQELACRIIPPGGWIFYHDYTNGTVEVTRALDDLHRNGRGLVHIQDTMLAFEQL